MVHKRWIMALVLFFLVGSLSAKLITFDDNWGRRGYNLISSTNSGVEIVFSTDMMRLVETDVDGKMMFTVTIPGCFLQNNEGAPNLPGVGRYIAIPQGSNPRVTIIAQKTEVIKNVDIAPAPPIPLDTDDSPPVYKKDPRIYNINAYYPESPVKISNPMKMRGVDCVIINICPFQYNPITRDLIVFRDLRVKINFIGGNGHFGEDRLRSRFWEPILRGNLINYSILPKVDLLHHALSRDGYEYIIIVPDDVAHEAWADTIKNWRKLQGISTEVFKLSQIGGNNATLIEKFVDSLYNNCSTPPVAVLLLSDYQGSGFAYGITSPPYSSFVSDNVYADVNHDDLPDIVFGRICSHDNTHLTDMVGKFLSLERNPPTDPHFYNRPLLSGGWQTTRWFQICLEIIKGYFINELGKDPTTQYDIVSGTPTPGCAWSSNTNTHLIVDYFGQSGLKYIQDTNPYNSTYWDSGSATGINREINAGAFIVQHRDHGSSSGWGHPPYYSSNLTGLNNDKYPYVFSINCQTGMFQNGSACFAENFHRTSKRAVGINAATSTSYSFVNDTYIFGLYDCMYPNFMPDYPNYDDQDTLGNMRPGFANVFGKYFLKQSNWPYNPGSKTVTYYLFHHHTDPFLTIFSEVPESLTVVHDPTLEAGVTHFTVTANDSSFIGLTVKNEIIGVARGTGAPVDITIPGQAVGDTMIVTVTLYNHYRYEKDVPVVSSGVAEEPAITESRIWLGQTLINDRLVINYALSSRQKVKVSLFDATGRKIKDFINSNLKGKGSVSCETKGISAGVYFVRIKNGNDVTTNQVILVR